MANASTTQDAATSAHTTMAAPNVPPVHDASSTQPPTSSSSESPPASSTSKLTPKPKPFPSITGGCICNTIRYRLLTSPLFVNACHCPDCQKLTGSVFGLFLNIEASFIQVISPVQPVLVTSTRRPGSVSRDVACPSCETALWSRNSMGGLGEGVVVDVRVGTLDFPGLMEPDVHSHVESKVDWIILPPGARTVPKHYNYRDMWPKSSLKRLDACLAAIAVRKLEGGDGEKTPTASEFAEDDEAFEERFKATEKALQERLERLRRKLEVEEGVKAEGDLERLAERLEIVDGQPRKTEEGEGEKVTAKLDIGDGQSDDR